MNYLPEELLIIIGHYLPIIDKHTYIITCKNLLSYKDVIMKNVIYHLFYVYYNQGCMFASIGIFDNIVDCRLCVDMNYDKYCKGKKPINKMLNKRNHFTFIGNRNDIKYHKFHGCFGFLVEMMYVNESREYDFLYCLDMYG